MIQIIFGGRRELEMSKSSWDEDLSNSEEESFQLIPGQKCIRKYKLNKPKNEKQAVMGKKKKRCQNYNKGACTKGSQCPFSHGFIPDIAKKICKLKVREACPKEDGICPYSHNLKRYPCKMLHIVGQCDHGDDCPFSHLPIDPESREEYLGENEDFIIETVKNNQIISEDIALYVTSRDLLNRKAHKEAHPSPSIFLPFIFGLHTYQTVCGEGRQGSHRRKELSEEESGNEEPFIIRLVTKNRESIPEKVPPGEEGRQSWSPGKSESISSPKQLQMVRSEQEGNSAQITPLSKFLGFREDNQENMCLCD